MEHVLYLFRIARRFRVDLGSRGQGGATPCAVYYEYTHVKGGGFLCSTLKESTKNAFLPSNVTCLHTRLATSATKQDDTPTPQQCWQVEVVVYIRWEGRLMRWERRLCTGTCRCMCWSWLVHVWTTVCGEEVCSTALRTTHPEHQLCASHNFTQWKLSWVLGARPPSHQDHAPPLTLPGLQAWMSDFTVCIAVVECVVNIIYYTQANFCLELIPATLRMSLPSLPIVDIHSYCLHDFLITIVKWGEVGFLHEKHQDILIPNLKL